jgi:hypothetical protein
VVSHVLFVSTAFPDIDVFYYLTLAFGMFAIAYGTRSKSKFVSYLGVVVGILLAVVALLGLAIKLGYLR